MIFKIFLLHFYMTRRVVMMSLNCSRRFAKLANSLIEIEIE